MAKHKRKSEIRKNPLNPLGMLVIFAIVAAGGVGAYLYFTRKDADGTGDPAGGDPGLDLEKVIADFNSGVGAPLALAPPAPTNTYTSAPPAAPPQAQPVAPPASSGPVLNLYGPSGNVVRTAEVPVAVYQRFIKRVATTEDFASIPDVVAATSAALEQHFAAIKKEGASGGSPNASYFVIRQGLWGTSLGYAADKRKIADKFWAANGRPMVHEV